MLSYQSNGACSLRARLSTRKDPAPSHYRKSKEHLSRQWACFTLLLGHRSNGCIPCYPSKCPFTYVHIGILSLRSALHLGISLILFVAAVAMSAPTGLPAGYSPPSSIVSENDHSAWITITAALGLCCVMLCLIMRLYVRTRINPPFGRDDGSLVAATVLLRELPLGFAAALTSYRQVLLSNPQLCSCKSPNRSASLSI
jgi:hypothetical protein